MTNKFNSSVRIGIFGLSVAIVFWAANAAMADGAPHDHSGHGAAPAKDAPHHGAESPQAQVDTTIKAYLAAQQLLAQDKLDGVETQFAKIRESAKALTDSDNPKVKEQAQAIAQAVDAQPKSLKDARSAFKPLSAAVIAIVQLIPPSADAAPVLYEASCPMAKSHWLQPGKDLANPFMGKEMSDCGKIERKLEPGGASSGHKH